MERRAHIVKLTLKQWMAMKDITSKQLAEKAGVSVTTICHIRTKKFKPRLDTLMLIAKALDIEIGDIEL